MYIHSHIYTYKYMQEKGRNAYLRVFSLYTYLHLSTQIDSYKIFTCVCILKKWRKYTHTKCVPYNYERRLQ